METVKGVVEAAERALLGDGTSQSREEPASVVQGEGTARDAYDAGNASGMSGFLPLLGPFRLKFFPMDCYSITGSRFKTRDSKERILFGERSGEERKHHLAD